jgi:hypothetical protein
LAIIIQEVPVTFHIQVFQILETERAQIKEGTLVLLQYQQSSWAKIRLLALSRMLAMRSCWSSGNMFCSFTPTDEGSSSLAGKEEPGSSVL